MKFNHTKYAIIITLFVLLLLPVLWACSTENKKGEIKISTKENKYYLAIGEVVDMNIEPQGYNYVVTSSNDNVVKVQNDNSIMSIGIGKAHITICSASSKYNVDVSVYDRIVSKEYICDANERRKCSSLNVALSNAHSGETIFIRDGEYEESVIIDKDISLIGEKNSTINSVKVENGANVKLANISFYTREYLKDNEASIIASEKSKIEIKSCKFFVDKKDDTSSNRIGGSAIYVCPNSPLVSIVDSDFTGYKNCIHIDSTMAQINVIDNRFSRTNLAIIVDVRDNSSNMPINKRATGVIKDNTYYDVEREVDFLFNGPSYNGELIIEKHDKI